LTLTLWLDAAPIRVTVPIIYQTRTLVVDLDLQTGFVRVEASRQWKSLRFLRSTRIGNSPLK
jgi:hypothetical protein